MANMTLMGFTLVFETRSISANSQPLTAGTPCPWRQVSALILKVAQSQEHVAHQGKKPVQWFGTFLSSSGRKPSKVFEVLEEAAVRFAIDAGHFGSLDRVVGGHGVSARVGRGGAGRACLFLGKV